MTEFVRPWCQMEDHSHNDIQLCPFPADWRGLGGCVHEHISTILMCNLHRERFVNAPNVRCTRCRDAGAGDVYVRLVWERIPPEVPNTL